MTNNMDGVNIYQSLIHIQSNLKAPKNKFSDWGDYHYRSCEDILEGVKPLLQETKTCIVISDEIVTIGNHNYIKATATLYSANGEQISNSAFAKEPLEKKKMDSAQITGATSSYARKYALNGLFAIDDTKDADTDEYKKEIEKSTNKTTPKKETNAMREKRMRDECYDTIKLYAAKNNIDNKTISNQIHVMFGKQSSKDLTVEELKALTDWATNYEVAS